MSVLQGYGQDVRFTIQLMAGERFINWIRGKYDSIMGEEEELIALKEQDLAAFKEAIWQKNKIIAHSEYTEVFSEPDQWFVGSTLNYAEHIFRQKTDENPAIICTVSNGEKIDVSWQELLTQTTSFADYLSYLEVKPRDVVVGVTANVAEQVMAFLACNSIGAVWANLSPKTSEKDLIRAFKDLKPKLLIASESSNLEEKQVSNVLKINKIVQSMESITQIVVLPSFPSLENAELIKNGKYWNDTFSMAAPTLSFNALPYAHPLIVTFNEQYEAEYHQQGEVLLNVFAQDLERSTNNGNSDIFVPKGVAGALLLGKTMIL